MSKKYPKRYQEYRGRRRRSGSLALKILIALLVLVLVGLFVFTVILGGGVEYTDDGVRLVLPWRDDTGEPSPGVTPSGDVSASPPVFIVEDPVESPSPSQPLPEPEPEAHPQTIGAVEVTAEELAAGIAADRVAEAKGNALVVEMKNSAGKVFWSSSAAYAGLTAEEGRPLADAVAALAEAGELHLVARVVCFRDTELAARQIGGPLMTRGGNTWYDAQGLRWVSPASEEARAYLIALCLELAEMGFDEILLEYAGYPYFGEVHVLATDDLRPEDITAPVAIFLGELKEALARHGAQMSLLVEQETVLGADPVSGMTVELMAQYADRVWVAALEGVDYADQPGCAAIADRLVLLNGEQENGSWADLK